LQLQIEKYFCQVKTENSRRKEKATKIRAWTWVHRNRVEHGMKIEFQYRHDFFKETFVYGGAKRWSFLFV
jgi:hypothetical protein